MKAFAESPTELTLGFCETKALPSPWGTKFKVTIETLQGAVGTLKRVANIPMSDLQSRAGCKMRLMERSNGESLKKVEWN